jgi:hypothetical protein
VAIDQIPVPTDGDAWHCDALQGADADGSSSSQPHSTKKRFVDWLRQLDDSEELAAEELAAKALGAAADDEESETPKRVLLARAAFALMDVRRRRLTPHDTHGTPP